jgi:hypothetical protein
MASSSVGRFLFPRKIKNIDPVYTIKTGGIPKHYQARGVSLKGLSKNPCMSQWTALIECLSNNKFDQQKCAKFTLAFEKCQKENVSNSSHPKQKNEISIRVTHKNFGLLIFRQITHKR